MSKYGSLRVLNGSVKEAWVRVISPDLGDLERLDGVGAFIG